MTFGEHVINFVTDLHFPVEPGESVEVMNPFRDPAAMEVTRAFYERFYNDQKERWMIVGINPGRFGGGVTGIPFTDPIRLQRECGIFNSWPKKQELSSVFIYEMISA